MRIYFDKETRDGLVESCFYDITEPGGYLFIRHLESLDGDRVQVPWRPL